MKIAVAREGLAVAGHFGHCDDFLICEVNGNEIIKEEVYENPGHKPGFLPNYLNDLGINVIISGGMGGGAIEIFNEKNIEVIIGATGEAKNAVVKYLNDELKSTGSVCHDHAHSDSCGGH